MSGQCRAPVELVPREVTPHRRLHFGGVLLVIVLIVRRVGNFLVINLEKKKTLWRLGRNCGNCHSVSDERHGQQPFSLGLGLVTVYLRTI